MSYLTREQFEKHLAHMRTADNLFVDTEGSLTHPHSETWGLSYTHEGVSEYFAFNHMLGHNLPKEWLSELKEVVESAPWCTFHHMKHDLRALRNLGINRFGKNNYCIMVMAHMVDENIFDKSLEALSKKYGGEPKKMSTDMKTIVDGFGYHMVPVHMWPEYAANDTIITDYAFRPIFEDFNEQGFTGELWNWEQRFTELLCDIEDNGVLIDEELAAREYNRGTQVMQELRSNLGFNPASPVDLGGFLVDELGLPVLKWTSGGKSGRRKPSFTKEIMERYDTMLEARNDTRARQILTYRGWQKCTSSSYLPYLRDKSPDDGRLRTEYKMHRAKTGRLTAARLHQIPKISVKDWNANTKKCIITDVGFTAWEADFSQLEFRLGAIYALAMDSRTQILIDAFNDPKRDVFTEMAGRLNLERDPTKTLNYTMQFGGGAERVSEVFNVSKLTARGIISDYFRDNPGFAKASSFAERQAGIRGFVEYWTGRRRHFKFDSEHHKAFNALCQGGAFEIVKRQGVRINQAGLNNNECRMDLTVHDSYRFSILNGKEDEYLPEIKAILEDVASLSPNLAGVRFMVEIKKWGTNEKWVPKNHSTLIV